MNHDNYGNIDIHQDQNGNTTGYTSDTGHGNHIHSDVNGNTTGYDSHFGDQHQYFDKDHNMIATTVHSPFRKHYLSMEDGNLHHHPSFTVAHHDINMPHFDSGISDSGFHDFRSDLLNHIR